MADDDGMPGAVRYRFGPLQRRALIAGFRGGQLAAAAAGLLMGLVALRSLPAAVGVVAAVAAAAAGIAVATVPLRGRTAEEWAPDAARFLAGSPPRRPPARAPFASFTVLAVDLDQGRPTASGTRAGVPVALAHTAPGASRSTSAVGVVADRSRGVYSAVLTVDAPGFLLAGDGDKDRRVAQWAGVLASAARDNGAVHRLQWVERSLPDGGSDLRRHADGARRLAEDAPAVTSYRELLDAVAGAALRHGVLLVVSVHQRRARRAVRLAGGGDGGACTVLVREVAALRRRLGDAQVRSSPPLGPDAVVAVLRAAVEADDRVAPDAAAALGRQLPADDPVPGPGNGPAGVGGSRLPPWSLPSLWSRPSPWPWPMAVDDRWSRVRTDATWHAVFWVAQWPRSDVPADFLGSLVLAPEVRRTVSVVMEPVGPARAARQVEHARTSGIADAELRRRGGFLATARRRREEESLVAREVELADGHAHYRFCGYVSVTAASADDLDVACGNVEQAAAQAGLELRRCYGDQTRAFLATLPLGYGLPDRG